MRHFLLTALLFASNAFALGPIPNGTYNGTLICTGDSPVPSTITLTDKTMQWDDQLNAFLIDPNGFFKLSSVSGQNGSGLGHFSDDEIHYEAIFDSPDRGKTTPTPGEDTFTFKQNKIYLTSTASIGSFGVASCDGIFSKVP